MQEKKINNLVINKVENQQTYEKMKTQGLINNDELYLVGGGTEVTSVNGQTGNVNLTAEDVDALSKDTKIPSKTSDLTNDSDYTTNASVDTKLEGKANSSHTHDDRYYTESEVNSKLDGKVSKSGDVMSGNLGINTNTSSHNYLFFGTNLNSSKVYLDGNQANGNFILHGYGLSSIEVTNGALNLKSAGGKIALPLANAGRITISDENNNDITLRGVKTPTTDNDATNKKYVDDAIANNTVDISEATTSTSGLMSAADKVKLNGIAENANNYTLPVATSSVLGGVKSGGDFTVNSSTGAVTITHQSLANYSKTGHTHTIANVTNLQTTLDAKVPTTRKINNKALSADITLSAGDISGAVRYDTASQGLTTTQKANARTNIGAGTSSFSGSYNDLTNKPTIPSAITESTVSGWGFTKNTGTYSKPSDGIPKSDLASAVQTSLGKADTALQSLPSHTHNYAGSSSAGGAANSVKTNLTIKLNGGATEGTNLFTFNGSTAKSIDITPSAIGAAASDHTHSYLPLSGGTLTGNLTGKYITGTWLQTTAATDKAGKFATIDNDGWIYYRTAAEVATDIGAVTADTFVAYTEAEIQSMWDNISV